MSIFNRIQESIQCTSLPWSEQGQEAHPGGRNDETSMADDEVLMQGLASDHYRSPQEEPRSPTGEDGGPHFEEGFSLDGRSLVFPDKGDYDDLSSINTDHYYIQPEMRILGQVEPEYEAPLTESRRDTSQRSNSHREFTQIRQKKMLDMPSDASGESNAEGCFPLWISQAPRWLKAVVAFSTLLLIGAIIMVGVGASLAVKNNKGVDTIAQNSPKAPESPGNSTGTEAPAMSPTGSRPVSSPIPTGDPNPVPTGSSSTLASSSTVTIYLTGGRFIEDALTALPDQLASLPNLDDQTVMVHLGDWNSPFSTACDEESYQTNVDLYSSSSVPVYFIPGDNEFNDCPDPEEAFSLWEQYMLNYETKFWPATTSWNVTRQQPDFAENFAFVHNRVLFVGINLVGGIVYDNMEWQDRHAANLQWIDDQYFLNEKNIEIMVVLGHSDPTLEGNANFFTTFYERVEFNYERQVVYVHRNLGEESWSLEAKFNGIENLMVVVVEGGIWPPMQMQINTKKGTVDVDQSEWYEEELKNIS